MKERQDDKERGEGESLQVGSPKPEGSSIRDTANLPSIAWYSSAFYGAPVGILFASRKGEILDVNPAFEEMTGIPQKKIVGKKLTSALKDFGSHADLTSLIESQSPFEFEYHGRVFEVTIPRIDTDLAPKTRGITTMFRDITEQKQAEEDLKRSEQREKTLRRVTPNIHYLISPEGVTDGEIIEISEAVDILGYTPEELTGKPLSDIMHPEEIERISRAFVLPKLEGKKVEEEGGAPPKLGDERRTAERRTLNLETRLIAKDGRTVPVMINATGLYEGEGEDKKFLGTYGVVTDISELKQAEKELRRKEEVNLALFEHSPIETIVVDTEARIVRYNLAKANSGSRLPNKGDVMYRDYAGKHKIDMHAELMQCIESRQIKSFPELNYEGRILSVKISPFPEGAIIASQDITERRQLEEQLRRRQSLDTIGTLASGIGHDFNNLLAVINGRLQFLQMRDEGLSEAQMKDIEYALESCEIAAELAGQLHSISTGRVPEKTSIDLCETAKGVFDFLGSSTGRLISKEVLLEPKEVYVTADATGLRQVLLNLGLNSVHAIEEKSAKSGDYIRIRAEEYAAKGKDATGLPDGEYVHIFFEDSGIGMTDEVKRRAFEPFFTRRERSTPKGQGLGLAMVDKIVTKDFEGHISIESEEGKGTTFHLYIPKAQPSKKARKHVMGVLGGDETVLVVDDEKNILRLVEDMLTSYGYTVIKASDGKQGLETYAAKKDSIGAVILDLTMPEMSGQKVLEEMLKIDPNVKVIISSGHSDEKTREGILRRAVGYVNKPYDLRQMAQTVRTVLDLNVTAPQP